MQAMVGSRVAGGVRWRHRSGEGGERGRDLGGQWLDEEAVRWPSASRLGGEEVVVGLAAVVFGGE